ncbi:MAG: molybdopterin molybdotransferase MoeA [Acidobacteria bacterium]|nr:molybdopterin molybdotransferase MoeA [Acidobacteriota bacterium]
MSTASPRDRRLDLRMLGVDEALQAVLAAVAPLPSEEIALEDSPGRCLADAMVSSLDAPPFDRTAMDGYALRAADAAAPPAELEVVETIAAGRDPRATIGPGQAAKIMTGAAIPRGADAIVMVERTEPLDGGRRVRILDRAEPGQHIRRRGEDLAGGSLLLPAGAFVGAPEIALLASEGRSRLRVGSLPSVTVISTGDELVPVGETPTGSCIRETNSWSLLALLRRMGIDPVRPGIAKDDPAALDALIARALGSDVLLLTGGVSMGDFDLVGAALGRAGCRPIFERVAIQPGKPLFFGLVEGRARRVVVFGLPGNPISSIVDFLVFARPALRLMMGALQPVDPAVSVELLDPIRRRPGRRAYLPARVAVTGAGRLAARPLPSMGSADLVALSRANALVIVHETAGDVAAGAELPALLLDDPFRR